MKFFIKTIKIFFVFQLLTSCIPFKDTLYLEKNKDKVADIEINADAYKPYRLQVDDILSVEIKSNNPKDVAVFSKTGNSTGGIVNQDQLYFDGYQIDNSGNIRIPVLGLVGDEESDLYDDGNGLVIKIKINESQDSALSSQIVRMFITKYLDDVCIISDIRVPISRPIGNITIKNREILFRLKLFFDH